jgi:hypothetical protein
MRQDFQKSMTVVDGPMRFVKHPDAVQKVSEPQSLKPVDAPFTLVT